MPISSNLKLFHRSKFVFIQTMYLWWRHNDCTILLPWLVSIAFVLLNDILWRGEMNIVSSKMFYSIKSLLTVNLPLIRGPRRIDLFLVTRWRWLLRLNLLCLRILQYCPDSHYFSVIRWFLAVVCFNKRISSKDLSNWFDLYMSIWTSSTRLVLC